MSDSKYRESTIQRLYEELESNKNLVSNGVRYSSFLDLARSAIVLTITAKDLNISEESAVEPELSSSIEASKRRIKQYQDEIERLKLN